MRNSRYLLDTKALIAFFNDEEGADFVERILAKVDSNRADGYISAITLTEIYYIYSRRVGEDIAKERVEQLKLSNLKIVPINEEVAVEAGVYKLKAIPIADAIIAASAKHVGAKVVTDDEHFLKTDVEVVRFR